jgi:hypothetical protein
MGVGLWQPRSRGDMSMSNRMYIELKRWGLRLGSPRGADMKVL